ASRYLSNTSATCSLQPLLASLANRRIISKPSAMGSCVKDSAGLLDATAFVFIPLCASFRPASPLGQGSWLDRAVEILSNPLELLRHSLKRPSVSRQPRLQGRISLIHHRLLVLTNRHGPRIQKPPARALQPLERDLQALNGHLNLAALA